MNMSIRFPHLGRQRQQGGGEIGLFAQYRTSAGQQKQKRKGVEKMQHGSLLSWNR